MLSTTGTETKTGEFAGGAPQRVVVDQIEDFLQQVVAEMPPEPTERRLGGVGRPRILPGLALWAGLLVCVLRGFSSQLSLWRLLTARQLWFFPRFALSDQAVYARLADGGTSALEQLFVRISAVLADRLVPYENRALAPFAAGVVALDHTTLDQVARRLPALRDVPAGDVRLLPGQVAGLFDVRRQLWRTIQFIADPNQNEKVTAREMAYRLPQRTLLLFDLGFFSFAWLDDLTEHLYFYVTRLRLGTSTQVVHTYYVQGTTFDGLVWLGKYRADRAKHVVRLVRFAHKGNLRSYLTNVLDPRDLPMDEVARLYARRWDIELAVNLIKRHLDLHLLWSAKDVVIQQQIWAVLIISQILQALRLEIAGRAEVDPFDVSMDLLVRWVPQLAYAGQDPIQAFVEQGRALRFIRPSSRLIVEAPIIPPDQLILIPPTLTLERIPRHSNRNCQPRPSKSKKKQTIK
jgi:hypothetical protein